MRCPGAPPNPQLYACCFHCTLSIVSYHYFNEKACFLSKKGAGAGAGGFKGYIMVYKFDALSLMKARRGLFFSKKKGVGSGVWVFFAYEA